MKKYEDFIYGNFVVLLASKRHSLHGIKKLIPCKRPSWPNAATGLMKQAIHLASKLGFFAEHFAQ